MEYLPELKIFGYVALAMFLGALTGFEREMAEKPAGMRTHMFVAGAAALLVSLGDVLVARFGSEFEPGVIRSDPIRILEAIIMGVSFLGAGTIIRREKHSAVEGLTTAATLFFTAGIGICVALQQFVLAGGATVLALATLRLMGMIETWFKRKQEKRS